MRETRWINPVKKGITIGIGLIFLVGLSLLAFGLWHEWQSYPQIAIYWAVFVFVFLTAAFGLMLAGRAMRRWHPALRIIFALVSALVVCAMVIVAFLLMWLMPHF